MSKPSDPDRPIGIRNKGPLLSQGALFKSERPSSSKAQPVRRGTGSSREESIQQAEERAKGEKKRKRRESETPAEKAQLKMRHLDKNDGEDTPSIQLEYLPHERPGYGGIKDAGKDFKILSGEPEGRLEKLTSLGYTLIPERETKGRYVA